MSAVQLADLLTIAVVAGVWGVLALLMLRHVVYWTGLGRSLFVFFATTCLSAVHGTLWRLFTGEPQPQGAGLAFRTPIIVAGVSILYFLWKYPWPLPSEGVRWGQLIGLSPPDEDP